MKEVPGHPLSSRSRVPSGPPANLFEAISSCRPAKPCYGKRGCNTLSRHYGAVAKGHQFRLMVQIRHDFLIVK